MHYGVGMAPGALYAEQRQKYPWLCAGRGAGYGLALYLLNDLLVARLLPAASVTRRTSAWAVSLPYGLSRFSPSRSSLFSRRYSSHVATSIATTPTTPEAAQRTVVVFTS